MGDRTYVYVFAQDDGRAVKVGIAFDPWRRLRQVQGGNPCAVKMHSQHGPMSREIAAQVEYRAHQLLSEYRLKGEWFSCPAVLAEDAVTDARGYVKNRRANLGYDHKTKRTISLGVTGL